MASRPPCASLPLLCVLFALPPASARADREAAAARKREALHHLCETLDRFHVRRLSRELLVSDCPDDTWLLAVTTDTAPAALCVGTTPGAEVHCGAFSGKRTDLEPKRCRVRHPIAPPPWLDALLADLGADAAVPFDRGDGFRLIDDGFVGRALVSIAGRWRFLLPPLDVLSPYGEPWLAYDATPLLGVPGRAISATTYSGGTLAGTYQTTLFTLATTEGDELRLVDQRPIGLFAWTWGGRERKEAIRAGDRSGLMPSHAARPHVEVSLEPHFTPGRMTLRRARVTLKKLPRLCSPAERRNGESDGDSLCPLPALTDILEQSGPWRYEDGKILR